jgi:hypothetical protein
MFTLNILLKSSKALAEIQIPKDRNIKIGFQQVLLISLSNPKI